jgi:hypothetical protein
MDMQQQLFNDPNFDRGSEISQKIYDGDIHAIYSDYQNRINDKIRSMLREKDYTRIGTPGLPVLSLSDNADLYLNNSFKFDYIKDSYDFLMDFVEGITVIYQLMGFDPNEYIPGKKSPRMVIINEKTLIPIPINDFLGINTYVYGFLQGKKLIPFPLTFELEYIKETFDSIYAAVESYPSNLRIIIEPLYSQIISTDEISLKTVKSHLIYFYITIRYFNTSFYYKLPTEAEFFSQEDFIDNTPQFQHLIQVIRKIEGD